MKLFGRTPEGFAKVLVVLVVIFLVSCGLCGLTLGIQSTNGGWFNAPNTAWANLVGAAGALSGIGVVLSFLGIVVVLVVWLASAAIRSASGKPKDNVQKVLDSDRDGDDKNPQ